ncbi:MAG: hypothetical protein ACRDKG_09660 [Actinomycetota bacterium]
MKRKLLIILMIIAVLSAFGVALAATSDSGSAAKSSQGDGKGGGGGGNGGGGNGGGGNGGGGNGNGTPNPPPDNPPCDSDNHLLDLPKGLLKKCGGTEGPPGDETCSDGIDNDGDGKTDQEDEDCQEPEGPPGDPTCSDGIDNDGDGLTDGDDPDCQGDEGPPGDETCSDGIDNDGDGLTDGDDPDCQDGGGENLCTGAAGDPGLLTEDTLGQTLWDAGLDALSPLTEDPERNGVISGPLSDALTGTPLEVVGDEAGCAIDLLLDETVFPVDL